jgi:hypothetical protein
MAVCSAPSGQTLPFARECRRLTSWSRHHLPGDDARWWNPQWQDHAAAHEPATTHRTAFGMGVAAGLVSTMPEKGPFSMLEKSPTWGYRLLVVGAFLSNPACCFSLRR